MGTGLPPQKYADAPLDQRLPGAAQPAGPAAVRPTVQRLTTLQGAIGLYCGLNGALMVVVPRQFSGPIWGSLQGQLPWVGSLFLAVGVALIGCVVLGARRRWVVACHFVAAAALLTLSYNLALVGLWPGAIFQIVLALGTALAPLVTRVERPGRVNSGYLFAVVFGAVNAIYGTLMLLLPAQFTAPLYDPLRPHLSLYGAAFLVTSAGLIFAQFRPLLSPWPYRLAHLAILLPSLTYGLAVFVPAGTWTGIAFYCGLAPLVASLPWTGPRLGRLDPRSFSARLAFVLALAAALPLILVVGLVTADQERLTRAEVEAGLEASAVATASDVSHYVGSYRKSLVTLAAYPGLLDLPPAAQQAVLRSYGETYPDVVAFNTFDAAGTGFARSDGQPPTDIGGREPFEELRRTNAPLVSVAIGRIPRQPVFAMFQPVRQANGSLIGVVGVSLASNHVAALLNQTSPVSGGVVYLVDAAGHAVAHPDQSLVARFADLSATPTVASLLARSAERGVVSSATPSGDVLAAYAGVPDFGWAVVVEQPAGEALVAVRSARNTAFGLLLLAMVLAMAAGIQVARALAGPLAALARATGGLARGDSAVPLPHSGTSDVRDLVSSFAEMRDTLAARTSERERLLAEIQRQAAELEATIASIPDGVIIDAPDGTIVRLNPAAEAIFGYTPDQCSLSVAERLRLVPREAPDGKPLPAHDVPVARALRGETVLDYRMVVRRGERKTWLSSSAAPIRGADGGLLGAVVVFADITSLHEMEEQREDFIRAVSHDLRQPLTVIGGTAQWLQPKLAQAGLAREATGSERIAVSAKRMGGMIQDLVDSTRLAAGKMEVHKEAVEPLRLITAIAGHVSSVAEQVRLRVEAPGRLPPVLVDPALIERVVVNLVGNALKYSVADKPVLVRVVAGQGEVVVSVVDEGAGIRPAELPHLFQRYYRAMELRQRHEGLGLGLYISRLIVEAQGGRIWVESEEGKGSTFFFTLPIAT